MWKHVRKPAMERCTERERERESTQDAAHRDRDGARSTQHAETEGAPSSLFVGETLNSLSP